jgi:DNA excision repair protein ERCC-4
MRLIVDLHERRSGLASELRLLGITVDEQRLVAGDYLLPGRALIERKTVPDLHGAVVRGRFWAQISLLRRSPCWPYLLIEGRSIYDGPLPAEAVRGLILAVSDLGVTVIRSDDARDSAHWIRRIAARRTDAPSRDRPVYAQRPKRNIHDSPAERALAAAPEVSTTTARALLTRFGTLQDVLLASPSDLAAVPGVGPKRAAAVQALASGTSHSGVSRNGLHAT